MRKVTKFEEAAAPSVTPSLGPARFIRELQTTFLWKTVAAFGCCSAHVMFCLLVLLVFIKRPVCDDDCGNTFRTVSVIYLTPVSNVPLMLLTHGSLIYWGDQRPTDPKESPC